MDRVQVARALERFSESLHDGHVRVVDKYAAPQKAFGPVALLPSGNALLVALSNTPDAKPGDEVVSIGGTPVGTLVDNDARYVSASPQATRLRAAQSIVPIGSVVLKSPDGAIRTAQLSPSSQPLGTFGMFDRPAGSLADLGAPDVYYVSLDSYGSNPLKDADVPAVKAAMAGKRGVILDMRGYPGGPAWSVLAHVAAQDSFGPRMAELLVTPDSHSTTPDPPQTLGIWASGPQGYTGPVIVLTGADTQSQAEHWTFFFTSKRRGKIVGGKTSGADGTITGVQLPGGYGMTFTGMVVQNNDGSQFAARGITPDVELEPTAADLRDGKDTILLRALQEIP
jgi:C-terminal processing protease CtpA/Prc